MTVHSAKGLEREVIFVPALVETVFPSNRSRARWTTNPSQIPHALRGDSANIPADPDWVNGLTTTALKSFDEAMRGQALLEERRLAYVAVTRAKQKLFASGHIWGSYTKKPRIASPYLVELAEAANGGAGTVEGWAAMPSVETPNPLLATKRSGKWPVPINEHRQSRLQAAASEVNSLIGLGEASSQATAKADDLLALANQMIAEAKAAMRPTRVVALPASLSVSQVSALNKDPEQFAANLFRPMPVAPSTAKRRGTEFHVWVEDHYRVSALVEPLDLPGAADAQIGSDTQLDAVKAGFLNSRWADMSPVQLEWDFLISIAGRAIAGRADAVFKVGGRFTIVDWKTGSAEFVDPLQLSLYQHAWAKTHSLDPAEVDALFVFLPEAKELRPDSLLTLSEIAQLLSGESDQRKAG
jgi:DNA helicase-2/ATP-dependent DNA helicase PcrA